MILFKKSRRLDLIIPMVQKITRYVAEIIALDNQPFSIVDDDGFKRLLEV